MSLTPAAVEKIAHLARLNFSNEDIALYTTQLSSILNFIEQMKVIDTNAIQPLAHPLDIAQRLRRDTITESDQRSKFQQIAPETAAGLYLVPQVIEEAS